MEPIRIAIRTRCLNSEGKQTDEEDLVNKAKIDKKFVYENIQYKFDFVFNKKVCWCFF